MSSFLHRTLQRALSSPLRARLSPCRPIAPQFSPSILQNLRLRPQTRFFTSSVSKLEHNRPFPHRAYKSFNQKPPFLSFLDRIPQNAIFWGIITINGVVFVMWNLTGQRAKSEGIIAPYKWMHQNFTNSWRNLSEGRIWTPITSTFSHESVSHILFNGFTFFFMARPVLEFLGTRKFLFLYMGGGIIASVASMAWSNLVKHRDVSSYGASGAISSVISLLACVAPRMTFQLYGIIPIPAWLAVTGIFAYDSYSAIYDKQKGTDVAGHVGGLLAGIGYYLALRFRVF